MAALAACARPAQRFKGTPAGTNGPFDAVDTPGKYERHWGAYGTRFDDINTANSKSECAHFRNPVHFVRTTRDELVPVSPTEDPGQRYLQIADGNNSEAKIVQWETGASLVNFGRPGRQVRDFCRVHAIVIDSLDSVYASEADTAKLAQRLVWVP